MTFTFTGITPHTITAAPVRSDGTAGAIVNPLQWTLNPATGLCTMETQNPPGNNAVKITPAVGANGNATLTAADVDENGFLISTSVQLVFSNVANPTVGFTFSES